MFQLSYCVKWSSAPTRDFSLFCRLAAAKLNMETALEDAEYMTEELERYRKLHLDLNSPVRNSTKASFFAFLKLLSANALSKDSNQFTVRLLLPGSLKTDHSDHSMIRTGNNSNILDFNSCFPSTRDWFNRLWLKFIVLVLQSDWPVLFK